MLPLEDRLRIALGAGIGVQLNSGDVETVSRMLVVLRQIKDATVPMTKPNQLAQAALEPFN